VLVGDTPLHHAAGVCAGLTCGPRRSTTISCAWGRLRSGSCAGGTGGSCCIGA